MPTLRRTLAAYHVWLKVLVLLAAFTVWVRWWFIPEVLVPRYQPSLPILAFPSEDAGLMFDLLPRERTPGETLVVLVGDSTMQGMFGVGGLSGPLYVALHRALPGRPVRIVDLSMRGVYALDAVFLIARALALEPDVLVYGISPRSLPFDVDPAWATTVEDVALDPAIVRRLGLPTILGLTDPSHLARMAVYSYWPVARLRSPLAMTLVHALPPAWGPLVGAFVSGPTAPAFQERGDAGGYEWTRDRFGFRPDTRTTRAFEAIMGLCEREPRCVLYQVPVNPAARHAFEPGFVDEFVAQVTTRATAAGVPFLDLHGQLPPERFVVQPDGPDALHLLNPGANALAAILTDALLPRLPRAAP